MFQVRSERKVQNWFECSLEKHCSRKRLVWIRTRREFPRVAHIWIAKNREQKSKGWGLRARRLRCCVLKLWKMCKAVLLSFRCKKFLAHSSVKYMLYLLSYFFKDKRFNFGVPRSRQTKSPHWSRKSYSAQSFRHLNGLSLFTLFTISDSLCIYFVPKLWSSFCFVARAIQNNYDTLRTHSCYFCFCFCGDITRCA